MAEDRLLPYGAPLPPSWLASLQEFIGTDAVNFKLTQGSATTVQVIAGTDSDQVGLGIDGLFRYISSTVTAAVTGTAGTYDVFAVCGPNEFDVNPTPPPPELDNTDYTFALQVLKRPNTPTLTGTVTNFRKVGSLTWSGSAITRVWSVVPPSPLHAPEHAVGGDDPLTPADIGAKPHPTPIVTALPGSPQDGDEIDFEFAVTGAQPVYARCRYVAADTPSPWKVIGSPALENEAAATISPPDPGGGYVTDANGPLLHLPVPGVYEIQWGAHIRNPGGTGIIIVAIAFNTAATPAGDDTAAINNLTNAGIASDVSVARKVYLTVPAATDIDLRYRLVSGGQFTNRWLAVRPVRLG